MSIFIRRRLMAAPEQKPEVLNLLKVSSHAYGGGKLPRTQLSKYCLS